MLVRKVHFGKYLLCRIIVPPARSVAIEAAIEDPEGNVQLLCLYNFPSMMSAGADEIDAVLPVGTILAIREPYFKTSLQSKNAFIRVDSPSDVIFPDTKSKLVQDIIWRFGAHIPGTVKVPSTAQGWKEAGNIHFKAAHWLAAATAYTKGLELDSFDVLLRANRAEAYLRLEYLSAALSDAERVLGSPDAPKMIRQKALLRAGKAAYSQGNFEQAVRYFQQYRACEPNAADADAWIHRALSRVTEQKNGRYDWLQILLGSLKSKHAMDLADYVGPVEIVRIPARKGRGMVAMKDIEIGELLLVAKPFAAAFPEALPPSEVIQAVNFNTKIMITRCDFAVRTQIIEKLHGNPELYDLVCHLWPGSPYPEPPVTYPPPKPSSDWSDRQPFDPRIDINVALVESICKVNLFRPQPLGLMYISPDPNTESESDSDPVSDHINSPSALYLLPSMINHSCIENATRAKITLEYTSGDTFSIRQKRLDKYDFTCTCSMCEDERADGERTCRRRDALVSSIPSLGPASGPSTANSSGETIKALEILIKQVSETYTSSHKTGVRLPLIQLHQRLSREYKKQAFMRHPRLYYEAVATRIKAVEATGISVIDKSTKGWIDERQRNSIPIKKNTGPTGVTGEGLVGMLLMIVGSFFALGDYVRAERWLRAAWWVEEITVEAGRKLFDEHYKACLRDAGLDSWSNGIH